MGGFYKLGDVAVGGRGITKTTFPLVKDLTGEALKKPKSAVQEWNDAGSGADRDVQIYRLHGFDGYRCIGDAVTPNGAPNLDQYRQA